MKGIKGTHLKWGLQPAGFALRKASGKKVVHCWDQYVTLTSVVESQAERELCSR